MRFGEGQVNSRNVFRICAVTLFVSFAVEVLSYLLFHANIPWYSVTILLVLFMYACESDLGYQDRVVQQKWMEEVERHLRSERTQS